MSAPNPTEGELDILRVLWSRKESMTVREVHEVLPRGVVGPFTARLLRPK